MAYFLKKTTNKKGVYLQIYESFYDPERGHTAREFDSSIIKKTFAGRINPVLFLSIFSFLYMLFYVIV